MAQVMKAKREENIPVLSGRLVHHRLSKATLSMALMLHWCCNTSVSGYRWIADENQSLTNSE